MARTISRVPVVVVSANEESAAVRAALDEGAAGYVPKSSPPQVIADALRFILEGGVYVPIQAMGGVPPRKPVSLADLGITHLYCSPYLQAVSGSSHGYDVVDQTRVSDDLGGPEAVGSRQNDPCPPHVLLRTVPIRDDRFQSGTVRGAYLDDDTLALPSRLAQHSRLGNPLSGSIH